jgi:hypothetical protein
MGYEGAKPEICFGLGPAVGMAGIQRAYSISVSGFNEFVVDGKFQPGLDLN